MRRAPSHFWHDFVSVFSESESSFAQEQGIAHSPYKLANLVSDPAVTADFHQFPRDASNWRHWSSTPFADWSNLEVIRHVVRSRWGPRFITFPAPSGVFDQGPDWQRKRIFAAAALLTGQYRYAHHHMQVWDVPNDPQWITDRMTPGRGSIAQILPPGCMITAWASGSPVLCSNKQKLGLLRWGQLRFRSPSNASAMWQTDFHTIITS